MMTASERAPATPAGGGAATGVLPSHHIAELVRAGAIAADVAIADDQIQPASLDLRLGERAYRVKASFLPGPGASVSDKIALYGMHEIELGRGAVLERGCVYIVPLLERLRLGRLSALANPKSSTGRLDVFTRLITDHASEFERVPAGYEGPLYAEISPRTFSIVVRAGSRLNQLRLRRGGPTASDAALRRLHESQPLLDRSMDDANIANGLAVTVDLRGDESGLVGYRARPNAGLIDVDRVGHYDPDEYWEPIAARAGGIVLNPDDFYILMSREAVMVPPDHAAEMVAYDTLVGEFRVHYAGFFDPGFGYGRGDGRGTRAVLEVRSHDVAFALEHGQVVGRLVYERLTDRASRLYGEAIGSSYQRQGLALSKQFRARA